MSAPSRGLRTLFAIGLAGLVLSPASRSLGAEPLHVNDQGQIFRWRDDVTYNIDPGPLGLLDNAAATARVEQAFASWAAVSTARLPRFVRGRPLPVDVTGDNADQFFRPCGQENRNRVIFDSDGAIIEALLGENQSKRILGFADASCAIQGTDRLTVGFVVLNGRAVDGVVRDGAPELDVEVFQNTIVHEVGHFLNLGHSQVGLREALQDTHAEDVPTMFAFNTSQPRGLQLDDVASLSRTYPTDEFRNGYGTISGTVFLPDGRTPFQGAYVVARSIDRPLRDAVGGSSGALVRSVVPASDRRLGHFDLPGLPPGQYTVEIEQIIRTYGIGPVSPPVTLPGPHEFWNGEDEAATSPPDDPHAFTELTVTAGERLQDIDVIINTPNPVPDNDTCEQARVISSLPFTDRVETEFATPDRVRCGETQALASNIVWYRYIAPMSGVVTVHTAGSAYAAQVAALVDPCDDERDSECKPCDGFQFRNGTCKLVENSSLSFSVRAGDRVRFAIADRDFSGGGELVVNVVQSESVPCVADCDGGGTISINELILAINIGLELAPLEVCAAADYSSDGRVGISELVVAVNGALSGCEPRTDPAAL